jgi:quercetin dioxygenase-like cupin family protein
VNVRAAPTGDSADPREEAVHHLVRATDIAFEPESVEYVDGFSRASLVDRSTGSVHMGLGMTSLDAGGRVDLHLHSYEESFFVTDGAPVLVLDRRSYRLHPGACGVVPVGLPHGWLGDDEAGSRWIDMAAPQPRPAGMPPDTFFLGSPHDAEETALDIRDPRSRHFFRLNADDMDLAVLQRGAPVDAPTVSASMATALLAYSGIAVKMLVDQRLDAQLSWMFMVEYQPTGVAQPHDHPLEESYIILDGEVDVVADDQRYTLGQGDVFWTGVGTIHAFYNESGKTVRWLETAAPQPPARHSYRFERDWSYLAEQLRASAGVTEAGR